MRPGLTTGHETILLAEDSAPIRTLLTQVLSAQGYTVLVAVDGSAAVKIAQEYAGEIHLLITDVVMPGLGGFELSALARTTRPDLRVLLMTGLTDDPQLKGYAMLAKPFTPIKLSQAVRGILDQTEL
jgi:DNA-binding response OmpR family regulator